MDETSFRPRHRIKKRRATELDEAVKVVGSLIPQSAGFALGITVIAYLCGWLQGDAYYRQLGAGWIVSSLPPLYFLTECAIMIFVVIFSAMFALAVISISRSFERRLNFSANLLVTVATICLLVAFMESSIIGPIQRELGTLGGYAMFFASGLFIGVAISEMRNSNLKWRVKVLSPLVFAVGFGLMVTPKAIGRLRANVDLNPDTNHLPIATLIDAKGSESWRVVQVIGEHALLLKPSKIKGEQILRLVEAKEIATIRTNPIVHLLGEAR